MSLKTKRDRSQPFTLNELHEIEEAAKKAKNQLVEQLASTMAETMKYMDKEYDLRSELLKKTGGFLTLVEHRFGEDNILGRSYRRLKEFIEGVASGELDPEVQRINFEAGVAPLEVSFRTNWASEIIAASLARMLRKDDGSYWNNITFVLHYLDEQFDVVVQRKSGKSVKEQLNDAEARIKELEVQLAERDRNDFDNGVERDLNS